MEVLIFMALFFTTVLLIILSVMVINIKKQSLSLNDKNYNIEEESNKMIDAFLVNNDVKYKESNFFSFKLSSNEISYKTASEYLFLNLITIYHEAGHFITKKPYYKLFIKFKTFNIFIVFPLYILSFVFNQQIKINSVSYILFAVFIIISIFSLIFKMFWEYTASKAAYKYVTSTLSEVEASMAKKFYKIDFYVQFFLTVFILLFSSIFVLII